MKKSPLLVKLAKIAPSIVCSVSYTRDPNYRWDGDGPDPVDEGFDAYDVDVTAKTIAHGEEISGRSSMGGTYEKPGQFDPDIGGYLNQMLREAITELIKEGVPAAVKAQAKKADAFLKREAKASYAKQRREIEAGR